MEEDRMERLQKTHETILQKKFICGLKKKNLYNYFDSKWIILITSLNN